MIRINTRVATIRRLNRVQNTVNSMGFCTSAGLIGHRGQLSISDIRYQNSFSLNTTDTSIVTENHMMFVVCNAESRALQKKLNLPIGNEFHNKKIINGLMVRCPFPTIQILLGTPLNPGIIANFSPRDQLKQLLHIMDNFRCLQKNQRIFVCDRIQDIVCAWPIQNPSDSHVSLLQGVALSYFCLVCMEFLPKHYYPQIYNYLLKIMPVLAPRYCNDITSCLMKYFQRLIQETSPDKNYYYFKELLKSSFQCTEESKLKCLLNISKMVSLLPANIIKRAAVLIIFSIKETLPKRLHNELEHNLTECLKDENLHFRFNPCNLNFHSKTVSPRK